MISAGQHTAWFLSNVKIMFLFFTVFLLIVFEVDKLVVLKLNFKSYFSCLFPLQVQIEPSTI